MNAAKLMFTPKVNSWLGALAILLSSFSAVAQADTKKPNFLFIAIDDMNVFNTPMAQAPDSFLRKVYPDDAKRQEVINKLTPNLQRLAQQSLTFDRAYTASPLCGPSRTALLTGVPAHVSGYYKHDKHFRHYETLKEVTTLPQYLKAQGYHTVGTGKVFHKGKSEKHKGLFSEWPDQTYSWSEWIEANTGTSGKMPKGKKRKVHVSKFWPKGGKGFTKFGTHNVPTELSNDYLNTQYAAEMIMKHQATLTDLKGQKITTTLPANKPWFLAVGIFAPHLPFIAEQKYFDMFPQEEMAIDRELMNWMKEDLKDLSGYGKRTTRSTTFSEITGHGMKVAGEEGDIKAWKALFQSYLAITAYADVTLGKLIDAIENNPQKENTIVVLWSDHGYHLGDKNRKGKATLWEASVHSNLIILDPRKPNTTKGLHTLSGASLQDIYPTIVALAGLERPNHLYGYDLTPVLEKPAVDWGKAVLSTYGKGNHTLRVGDFRYIRFKNGDQELYNLAQDPHEYTNLATQKKHKEKLKQFSKLLDERLGMGPGDY